MSADNKTGLAPGDASEIEDVTRTAGHDAEGEMTNSGDARTEPDVGSVNIEKVAQLAKLCATGTPSDQDFKVIKERVGVAGNEVADESEWQTAEKAASSELPRDPNTGHDAFFQQIEMAKDKSDFSAGLKAMGRHPPVSSPILDARANIPHHSTFFHYGLGRRRSHVCLALPR